MLKKRGYHQKVDSREISSSMFESDTLGEHGAPTTSSPMVSLVSSLSARSHRRVHSDAQSPSLDRRSRGESPDEETDPFKKSKKKQPLRMGGSFRGKRLLTPDEGVMSSPSEDATPGTKKKLINKLLSRARSSTRERLPPVSADSTGSEWNESDDTSSEDTTGAMSRNLERQDSVVIHDVDEKPRAMNLSPGKTPSLPRLPVAKAAQTRGGGGGGGSLTVSEPDLSPRLLSNSGRLRGDAIVVKPDPSQNMVQTIEATMARILQQLEECSVPLKELEGMRQEEAQAQQDTQSQLSLLSEQLARAKATSNLSEYEETMRDLSSSDLMPRFRFGPDQLANIDDHLTSMENKVLASISSQKRSTYVNTALLALIIGTILAWWF